MTPYTRKEKECKKRKQFSFWLGASKSFQDVRGVKGFFSNLFEVCWPDISYRDVKRKKIFVKGLKKKKTLPLFLVSQCFCF